MKTSPTAWSIAGHDPTAGAGITLDTAVLRALGVTPASVITALTAQSRTRGVSAVRPVEPDFIARQIETLLHDGIPGAIKIGMLGGAPQVTATAHALKHVGAFVVCDPVLGASSGHILLDEAGVERLKTDLFPLVDLLTPNLPEAARLTGKTPDGPEDIPALAAALRALGPRAVLIKGGHAAGPLSQDYYADAEGGFWLQSTRLPVANVRGTGCFLSAAIASFIARRHDPRDAVTLAKTRINQGLRTATRNAPDEALHLIPDAALPLPSDLPWITESPHASRPQAPFPNCGPEPIGLYPLVDDAARACDLMRAGVSSLQLRLKDIPQEPLEKEIAASIAVARETGCRLFINDHWDAAIRLGAYGVHLGQQDLPSADIARLHAAGLRLGISTHSFYEMALALAHRPSYIAAGTVFPSPSKPGLTRHLGVDRLEEMVKLAGVPVVAIGGIRTDNAEPVIRTGVAGVAVISEMRLAPRPAECIQEWKRLFEGKRPAGGAK